MTEQVLTSHRPVRQWTGPRSDTLADVLERVLDKGVVIVGDVVVSVLDVELLTLRLRLFIASADTAREMGLDWWLNDPFFSSKAVRRERGDGDADLAEENRQLRQRLASLEGALGRRPEPDALTDDRTATAERALESQIVGRSPRESASPGHTGHGPAEVPSGPDETGRP